MSPFEELMCVEVPPAPAVIVIFGATGDLARRKLFPALRRLEARGLLAAETRIVACARRAYDDGAFRAFVAETWAADEPGRRVLERISYLAGENGDGETYRKLAVTLAEWNGLKWLFYLALASDGALPVVAELSAAGLLTEPEASVWRHVVLEKPFGYDSESAELLEQELHRHLREEQIYRIDHYLGKETVQNIMMLRFANAIFEPIWKAEYIDHVEITVAETLGVENRAAYYEQAGALRDMVQNHLLQLLSLTAMEPPVSFAADDVRDEKSKVLKAIRPFDPTRLERDIVRAQYSGYRAEPGVAADSRTETCVAARLWIDNWRWRGVPFYLRSGKRMSKRKSEIAIVFKYVPHSIFSGIKPEEFAADTLVLELQPDEGVVLELQAKKPGPKLCLGRMNLRFDYGQGEYSSGGDAYERLLLDALAGDSTLFIRGDFINAAWRLLTPVLRTWQNDDTACTLESYEVGGDARGVTALPAADGRSWRTL